MKQRRPDIGRGMRFATTVAALLLTGAVSGDDEVRFNRDIRPILSDHCYQCHGPDSAARKAGLRLDSREGAVELGGVIIPGDPTGSELLKRVHDQDPDSVMPPAIIRDHIFQHATLFCALSRILLFSGCCSLKNDRVMQFFAGV